MVRTKQTPRNPNIEGPVAVIGSDIQSTERRPTPRPTQGEVPIKGGKQPRKHLSKKITVFGWPTKYRIKKNIIIGLD